MLLGKSLSLPVCKKGIRNASVLQDCCEQVRGNARREVRPTPGRAPTLLSLCWQCYLAVLGLEFGGVSDERQDGQVRGRKLVRGVTGLSQTPAEQGTDIPAATLRSFLGLAHASDLSSTHVLP